MTSHIKIKSVKQFLYIFVSSAVILVSACVSTPTENTSNLAAGRVSADKLMPVDCLLPPKIKKLGSQLTYLEPRKPAKSTALECEIRGGEYVAYDRADFKTSLNVWLQKAKAGDVAAQTYVGEIFEKGLGVSPDYKTAFQWYAKAAEQNYSSAQINLGYLYEKGLGVTKDPVKALNLYRLASGITVTIDYSSVLDEKSGRLASDYSVSLNTKNKEIHRLRTSLEHSENRLSYHQQQLKKQSEALALINQKLDQKIKSIAVLAELQKQGKIQEDTLRKTKENITKLEIETKNTNLPVIEVKQPLLLTSRSGGSLVAMSNVKQNQIIKGLITAPAGIKEAFINAKPLTIDENGNFQTALNVSSTTEIEIIAVDQVGKKSQLMFQLLPTRNVSGTIERKRTFISKSSVGSVDFGRYFALVIGNNKYDNFPDLKTAVNDAEEVGNVLKSKYGVETTVLKNADRYTILSAINKLKSQITEKDNLLIYYAGHGQIDKKTQQGYWLPIDAEKNNTANWIPNSGISDLLNTISAKHVLVVADSCYSGSMSNTTTTRLNNKVKAKHVNKWLKAMAKTRSRTVLTSGGLEPVLDTGSNGHSVFANAFIRELKESKGIIDAYQIYLNINQQVSARAMKFGFNQVPDYAPIKHAGHGGGEFLLVEG